MVESSCNPQAGTEDADVKLKFKAPSCSGVAAWHLWENSGNAQKLYLITDKEMIKMEQMLYILAIN